MNRLAVRRENLDGLSFMIRCKGDRSPFHYPVLRLVVHHMLNYVGCALAAPSDKSIQLVHR
ncbi:MAG: hypothetical protein WBQ34_12070, partial [Candidatus Acidiferrales bacterium]